MWTHQPSSFFLVVRIQEIVVHERFVRVRTSRQLSSLGHFVYVGRLVRAPQIELSECTRVVLGATTTI